MQYFCICAYDQKTKWSDFFVEQFWFSLRFPFQYYTEKTSKIKCLQNYFNSVRSIVLTNIIIVTLY